MELLLRHDDINVNWGTCHGETPLFMAAWKGLEKVVELLLEKKGIDVNKTAFNGSTPLL